MQLSAVEAGKWASSQLGHYFCSLDNTRQEQPRKGAQRVCVCVSAVIELLTYFPLPFCHCLLDKYNLHMKTVTLKHRTSVSKFLLAL